jgi:hypothetical protein
MCALGYISLHTCCYDGMALARRRFFLTFLIFSSLWSEESRSLYTATDRNTQNQNQGVNNAIEHIATEIDTKLLYKLTK